MMINDATKAAYMWIYVKIYRFRRMPMTPPLAMPW